MYEEDGVTPIMQDVDYYKQGFPKSGIIPGMR